MAIRLATVHDAVRIAEVHVRSWQGAYRGLMPPEYLDALDPAARAKRWNAILSTFEGTRAGVLVTEDADGVRGFASFGPTRDPDEDPEQVGEVKAIYLLPAAWGSGCGRELMTAALDQLAAAGFSEMTLWVLAANARARRFYAAAGLHPDGAEKLDDRDGLELRELRYRRALP
jgi:GNAT superfamily N-acetyltransferase